MCDLLRLYGIRGDGVTDDAPNIVRALNAAGQLTLPQGVYRCNSPLVLAGKSPERRMTLAGDGGACLASGIGNDLLTLTDNYVNVRNLVLDMAASTNPGAAAVRFCTDLTNLSTIRLDNLTLRGCFNGITDEPSSH